MKTLLRTMSLLLLTLMVVILAACGGTPGASTPQQLNVAFLPKAINNPYFDSAAAGGKKAADELKGSFKQVGPSNANAAEQVPFINTLTQQHVSAIVVSADDPNAIAPSLKQAIAQGIKVVSYDSDTAPDARQIFVNQASAEDLGRTEVQVLAKQINYTGDIAILSATSTATNQNSWIDFMKDELSKPEYSKMHLVKIAYGNDDDQTSYNETQGLLQAYPNLKGIISPTTVGIAAAARYLEASGNAKKVALTGLGTPNSLKKYVKDGTIQSFELWDVSHLGYLAYYAASALVSGKITGKQGDTFTAGSLGQYTVGENGTVVLGPPTVFNSTNIDQFNF
ncbi:MAG: rhamnose ABC transporter substrate-binding protein [Ktedonobacteraceae bacterium]|nr:rhamnose ABC transporter substrate-binding protein [Ktedonobacteraceae bacterium]